MTAEFGDGAAAIAHPVTIDQEIRATDEFAQMQRAMKIFMQLPAGTNVTGRVSAGINEPEQPVVDLDYRLAVSELSTGGKIVRLFCNDTDKPVAKFGISGPDHVTLHSDNPNAVRQAVDNFGSALWSDRNVVSDSQVSVGALLNNFLRPPQHDEVIFARLSDEVRGAPVEIIAPDQEIPARDTKLFVSLEGKPVRYIVHGKQRDVDELVIGDVLPRVFMGPPERAVYVDTAGNLYSEHEARSLFRGREHEIADVRGKGYVATSDQIGLFFDRVVGGLERKAEDELIKDQERKTEEYIKALVEVTQSLGLPQVADPEKLVTGSDVEFVDERSAIFYINRQPITVRLGKGGGVSMESRGKALKLNDLERANILMAVTHPDIYENGGMKAVRIEGTDTRTRKTTTRFVVIDSNGDTQYIDPASNPEMYALFVGKLGVNPRLGIIENEARRTKKNNYIKSMTGKDNLGFTFVWYDAAAVDWADTAIKKTQFYYDTESIRTALARRFVGKNQSVEDIADRMFLNWSKTKFETNQSGEYGGLVNIELGKENEIIGEVLIVDPLDKSQRRIKTIVTIGENGQSMFSFVEVKNVIEKTSGFLGIRKKAVERTEEVALTASDQVIKTLAVEGLSNGGLVEGSYRAVVANVAAQVAADNGSMAYSLQLLGEKIGKANYRSGVALIVEGKKILYRFDDKLGVWTRMHVIPQKPGQHPIIRETIIPLGEYKVLQKIKSTGHPLSNPEVVTSIQSNIDNTVLPISELTLYQRCYDQLTKLGDNPSTIRELLIGNAHFLETIKLFVNNYEQFVKNYRGDKNRTLRQRIHALEHLFRPAV